MNRLTPSDFAIKINEIEYQKGYLFRIVLPVVDTKQYLGTLTPDPERFELCTSSTTLPSLATDVQRVAFYNSELKVSTKTTYSNWSATFKLDSNRKTVIYKGNTTGLMNTWDYLYCWQLMANWPHAKTQQNPGESPIPSFTSALPKDYKKDIELFLLNEDADERNYSAHYKLEGASPVNISGGSLSYSDDSILSYTVEFAFDRFIVQDF